MNTITYSLKDIFVKDVVAISLNSIELIPLLFYKPGGSSLTIYIYSEDVCESCPWKEYQGSKKAFDLRNISLEKILRRYYELKPDILFFSGGDLLTYNDSYDILKILREKNIKIGVKHEISKDINISALSYIDALLIEIKALKDLEKIDHIISLLEGKIHIEMLIDEISEDPERRAYITLWIKDLCKRFPKIYKMFYLADKDDEFIERYHSVISRLCERQYTIITSHLKYIPEEVSCVNCGAIIGRRVDGVIIRPFVNNVSCPKCGFKIFHETSLINRSRAFFTKIFV